MQDHSIDEPHHDSGDLADIITPPISAIQIVGPNNADEDSECENGKTQADAPIDKLVQKWQAGQAA